MTRVYLVVCTHLFRDAIGAILRTSSDIELVGEATQADVIVDDVARLKPDVILLEEDDRGPMVTGVRALLTSPIPCRLITLRMDADGMHVWSQTWHTSVRPHDLVDAIVTATDRSGRFP